MKLLHAADLHLDSPMRGLAAYDGAPVEALRGATRRAFESLIELCLREQADMLLIAGDVYDGDWRDFSTGLYFRRQLARLREAGVEVVLIHGNHDAASVITRRLALPDVHVLADDRPQSAIFEDLGLAVHGQSFATRAVTENLAAGYPAPIAGLVNIGLLHTALSGAPGHERYAPCTLDQLASHGYDYWALGHVHERAVLREHPHIVFPGNLQGRHVRECGPRGATMICIEDGRLSATARTLDHVRWASLTISASGLSDDASLLASAQEQLAGAIADADGRLLALRLTITGQTPMHARLARERERLEAELRALCSEAGGQAWLESVQWQLSPPPASAGRAAPQHEALEVLGRLAADPASADRLLAELRAFIDVLPAECKDDVDGLNLTERDAVRRLLSEAHLELVSALGDVEADER